MPDPAPAVPMAPAAPGAAAQPQAVSQPDPPIADKRGYLLDRMVRAAGNLVELRIVTAYGQVDIKDFEKVIDGDETPAFSGNQTNAFTSINMLTGDIVAAIHPSFTAPGNAALLEFHNKQVELGRQIVADNIKALSEVIATIWDKLA